jgi:hypothetical protein
MKETWKIIVDFEDYEISSNGKVRNKHTLRILKTWRSRQGYVCVQIRKNKNLKKFLMHRLVASAFIPNVKYLPDVHHKNNIKNDNDITNLEWVTGKMNQVEMWIHHLKKMGYKIIRPEVYPA